MIIELINKHTSIMRLLFIGVVITFGVCITFGAGSFCHICCIKCVGMPLFKYSGLDAINCWRFFISWLALPPIMGEKLFIPPARSTEKRKIVVMNSRFFKMLRVAVLKLYAMNNLRNAKPKNIIELTRETQKVQRNKIANNSQFHAKIMKFFHYKNTEIN